MKCDLAGRRPCGARIQIGGVLCVFLFGGLAAGGKASAAEAAASSSTREADGTSKPSPRKLLFLGNSITLHGPAPAIGWSGNWGMAASAREKDYVHLVTSGLSGATGAAPAVMIKNIADFERQYASYDATEKLQDARAFGADLIILAIGENVPKLDGEEAQTRFGDGLGKLLRSLKADKRAVIVVRSCFWPNKAKDQVLRQACQAVGGIFVDISGLGKDESNYARSERAFSHKGVAAHPGDKGMRAMANAILEAINNPGKATGK